MVLIRRLGVLGVMLGAVLFGGCSESLFGAQRSGQGNDGGGGGDGGDVPSSCPATCIADAAADFDGTPLGKGGHWRYLDDHRDRTWSPMTVGTTEMTGADANNRIATCTANPSAPACRALPGALLVSSAGSTSSADPAIEFTAPDNQVIQLSLHVFVPSGADQTIRLYRNSRDDVLFTGIATAGTTLSHAITLDALAGDRFLVAVAPTGNGAADVGLQLFVNATGTSFPSTCQLALPFTAVLGPTTGDQCRGTVFTHYVVSSTPVPGTRTPTQAVLGIGPFQEHGSAVDIQPTRFLGSDLTGVLDWSRDMTVQFWVRLRSPPSSPGEWLFSDLDPEFGAGVEIWIAPPIGPEGPKLLVKACTDAAAVPNSVTFEQTSIGYPDDGSWQFVRVVRSNGQVNVCLNGNPALPLSIKPDASPDFATFNAPNLAKDGTSSSDAYFDGWLDDVRAIAGALPCN